MNNDFIIALFIGLLILLLFWIVTLCFIYLRNPPNSKLTPKLVIQSLTLFLICFLILFFLVYPIRFEYLSKIINHTRYSMANNTSYLYIEK